MCELINKTWYVRYSFLLETSGGSDLSSDDISLFKFSVWHTKCTFEKASEE